MRFVAFGLVAFAVLASVFAEVFYEEKFETGKLNFENVLTFSFVGCD